MSAQEQTFEVKIVGHHTLKVSEIWPDGDAPANPTVVDVIIRLREWRGAARLLSRLDYGAQIDGEMVFSTCPGEW